MTGLGLGLGIPFIQNMVGSGYSDGYYYQLDVADPRLATGWIPTSKFHDGIAGDTTTKEETAQGGTDHRTTIFLVVNNAGMTIDEFQFVIWYKFAADETIFYGSNDLIAWEQVLYSSTGEPNHSSYSAEVYGWPTLINYGPYKYIAGITGDNEINNQAKSGISDIRLYLNSVEVGPA
jgi:hypothetical protein